MNFFNNDSLRAASPRPRRFQKLSHDSLLVVVGFLLILNLAAPSVAYAQLHGAQINKTVLNLTDPTPPLHFRIGDTSRVTITVMNLDQFGDSFRITGLTDVVHFATGDFVTNLTPRMFLVGT